MEIEISVKAAGADQQQLATIGAACGEALREAFSAASSAVKPVREAVEPR